MTSVFTPTPRLKTSATFLEVSYAELEERNLKLKRERNAGRTSEEFAVELRQTISNDDGVKALTVCFSDLEGKFHMLDYNKKYVLEAENNLTFDGSSIRGFAAQNTSDLRLKLDWTTFRWLPADVFGAGKVLIFADVHDQDDTPYTSDYRVVLKQLTVELAQQGMRVNVAPEIEGFVLEGEDAEQHFDEKIGFKLASEGGYFNVLPQDKLRQFIDRLAEATRAMAFENEKDHPEVAPSQFETNYRYTDVLHAADYIQLYKVMARQIAKTFGLTASFLPKPIPGINGSGMHSNISISQNGRNIFYDEAGKYNLSQKAHRFLTGVLFYANDLCLTFSASVNAYRRLDPHFEAPNEIKVSPSDRGSMIRIPIGNEKSARIEVRTVAPDTNPYLTYYLILKAGLKAVNADDTYFAEMSRVLEGPVRKLPGTIYAAIEYFRHSDFVRSVMGENNLLKFVELKESASHRCPAVLGTRVKSGEVWYHHEVRNQVLWNQF
ncbi:glutamine synthetase [Candidatus Peregrinibacteria bacterium]|nr:glutamine synthetase [Candidatus Peregrinibacteria bacterium]